MTVFETIKLMMSNYPSLYPTRIMALLTIFNSHQFEWIDGELVPEEGSYNTDHPLSYTVGDVAEAKADYDNASKKNKSSCGHDYLFKLKQNYEQQFIIDHVDILAADVLSPFRKPTCINFDGTNLGNFPVIVTEDWLDAAKELCFSILGHEFVSANHAEEYIKRERENLETSKVVAKQFLEARGYLKINAVSKEYRLKELQREAEALGYHLVED